MVKFARSIPRVLPVGCSNPYNASHQVERTRNVTGPLPSNVYSVAALSRGRYGGLFLAVHKKDPPCRVCYIFYVRAKKTSLRSFEKSNMSYGNLSGNV
jgi:hypothetical protein